MATLSEAFASLPTPCFLVDEALLVRNLEILRAVKERAGCRILLAQKAFSMYPLYPRISAYLDGATASGLYEARLAHEHLAGESHVFSPAYQEASFGELLGYCDHFVFNSLRQWQQFGARALAAGKICGLRINPECSTQDGHAIYDPCAPCSRLGITRAQLPALPEGVSGLHFHTLCEQDADALETTLDAVEAGFGAFLPRLQWLNLGGGHHITKPGYDIDRLARCVRRMRERYGLTVYLEPGEAVALNAGFLVASVADVVENGVHIAILDASAACHMPDVLEMPYRPPLLDAGEPGEKPYSFRLAGPTCLAGDVIGDYSFDAPLQPGDRLVFGDMAIYSMVKTNTFNGMPLPAIALRRLNGTVELLHRFGYADFKSRLA